jgi:hypothetical protein
MMSVASKYGMHPVLRTEEVGRIAASGSSELKEI